MLTFFSVDLLLQSSFIFLFLAAKSLYHTKEHFFFQDEYSLPVNTFFMLF